MAKRKTIAERLRSSIAQAEKRGMSRYAIAKAAQIRYGQLCRIADGENLPRLDTAEKIATALSLRLDLVP